MIVKSAVCICWSFPYTRYWFRITIWDSIENDISREIMTNRYWLLRVFDFFFFQTRKRMARWSQPHWVPPHSTPLRRRGRANSLPSAKYSNPGNGNGRKRVKRSKGQQKVRNSNCVAYTGQVWYMSCCLENQFIVCCLIKNSHKRERILICLQFFHSCVENMQFRTVGFHTW